jgi:hypothetical protein
MKFIIKILGRLWSIAFLLFFALFIYSTSGGNLTGWTQSYLNSFLQLLTDWMGIVVSVIFVIVGINYGNKVGWKTVGKKIGKYFQSDIDDKFQFKLRGLSLSKLLFATSIVFVAISLSLFNYELRKQPECKIDLLSENTDRCVIDSNLTSSIRIVVHSGGYNNTVNLKIPIDVHIESVTAKVSQKRVYPEASSTGGDGRYNSNLNYGIFDLPKNQTSNITVSATSDIKKLHLFEVKILTNPNEWLKKVFSSLFLVTLFLSIYFRQKTFKKGILRSLPYFVYFVVAMGVFY